MSEARINRLDEDLREIGGRVRNVEAAVIRIETMLQNQLPHLATKAELAAGLADLRAEIGGLRAELATKPNRGHAWAVLAALTGAYTVALAAAALLLTFLPRWFPPPHG